MGTKVYVGNLSNTITEKDLDKEFGRFGKLTEVWIAGDSGFGFIHFKDPKDASKAVKTLDGKAVSGSRLRVEMSHGYRGGRRRGGPPPRRSGPPRGSRDRNIRPLMRSPPRRDSRSAGRDRPKASRRRHDSGNSPPLSRKRVVRSPHSPRVVQRQKSYTSSSRSPSPAPRRPVSPSPRRGASPRALPIGGSRRSPAPHSGRDYLPLPPPLPPLPPHDYDRYRDRDHYPEDLPLSRPSYNGQSGWERSRSPPLPPPLTSLRYRSRSPIARRRSPLPLSSQVLSSRYVYDRDPPPPLPPLAASSSRYREEAYRGRSLTPPLRRSPVSLMDLKVSPPSRLARGQPLPLREAGRPRSPPPRGRSPPPPRGRSPLGRGRSPLSPPRRSPIPRGGSPGRLPLRRLFPRPRTPPSRDASRSPLPPRPRSPLPIGYNQAKPLPRGYDLSPPPSPMHKRVHRRSFSGSISPPPARRYSSSSGSSYSRSPSPPPQNRGRKQAPKPNAYPHKQVKSSKKVSRRSYTPDSPPPQPRRGTPPRGYANAGSRERSYPSAQGRYSSRSSSSGSSPYPRKRPHSPAPYPSSRSISPEPRPSKGELRRAPHSPLPQRGKPLPPKNRPLSRSPIRKKKKSKR